MENDRLEFSELLGLIPPDASLVVEVGCGKGLLGEQYRRINPFGRYVGMEADPAAAAEASGRLDRVIAGDAGEIELDEDDVDCLVFGDILAHLRDPRAVLRRQAAHLREGGQVIARVPNVQHWTVIAGLMRGHWNGDRYGADAAVPLRFFTLAGIRALLEAAGLTPYEVRTCGGKQEGFAEFAAAFRPAAEKLGLDLPAFFRGTAAPGYLVRAVKGQRPRPLLIQSILGESKVCARVRILEPNRFLETVPGVRTLSGTGTVRLTGASPAEDKVFIWQRMHVGDAARQRELLRRGYLVLAEMDDDPLRWPEYPQSDFFTFRSCHGVQVSTEALAAVIRPLNPNVAVFPNQLAFLPPPRIHGEPEQPALFFGALNREADWLPVMPELNRVLRDRGRRTKVTVIHDRAFFNALDTADKEFIPFCSYPQYIAALRRADVALLPLEPGRFNSMKSDLKFLECAGHGTVALASPTVYAGSVRDGETGLLYRTPAEFGQKLTRLLGDADLRQRIAAAAYRWVGENRLLCLHYRQRLLWYRSLLERRPELDGELERRVPGILDGGQRSAGDRF